MATEHVPRERRRGLRKRVVIHSFVDCISALTRSDGMVFQVNLIRGTENPTGPLLPIKSTEWKLV